MLTGVICYSSDQSVCSLGNLGPVRPESVEKSTSERKVQIVTRSILAGSDLPLGEKFARRFFVPLQVFEDQSRSLGIAGLSTGRMFLEN